MTRLRFTKMHGAGNDFIVIDGTCQDIRSITPAIWRKLAHRQLGVGADQILIVEPSNLPNVDFKYRIFNADGGEVEQCGNGSRCFVRFVHEEGLSTKNEVRVEVSNGLLTLKRLANGSVEVDMGRPIFNPPEIPFNPSGLTSKQELHETLYALPLSRNSGAHADWIAALSMGNPHAVQVVEDLDSAPVLIDGPLIESHPAFPKRVNAGFMQILNRHSIRLRVYERGAGETLSCGTGACAAAVSGIRRGLLDSPVNVSTRGGELEIMWDGFKNPNAAVLMRGPTQTVYRGEIDLDTL
ncbi:MAG: diaminopimelate epimerase [Burkholderiaceae bacterium]|nr:diaminopimelate epimerase [Burkholderiaceae bacterium]